MHKLMQIRFLCLVFLASGADAHWYKVNLSDSWYPHKSKILQQLIASFAPQDVGRHNFEKSNISAILVPHGPYHYSGRIAAQAYDAVAHQNINRVIVIAPAYHHNFSGVTLPSKYFTSYKNSLGMVQLDNAMLDQLRADSSKLFQDQQAAHESEHGIDMQLPMITYYFGMQVKLVPLLVGRMTDMQSDMVVRALLPFLDDGTLLIISSDLAHYGPIFLANQHKLDISSCMNLFDHQVARAVEDLDPVAFDQIVDTAQAKVPGYYAIQLLINIMNQKHITQTEMVGYGQSCKEEKNPQHSISYVSMIFA